MRLVEDDTSADVDTAPSWLSWTSSALEAGVAWFIVWLSVAMGDMVGGIEGEGGRLLWLGGADDGQRKQGLND